MWEDVDDILDRAKRGEDVSAEEQDCCTLALPTKLRRANQAHTNQQRPNAIPRRSL